MTEQNPYSTPDAALDTGAAAVYEPSVFSFSGRIGRLRYLAYGIGANFVLMLIMVPLMALTATTGGGEMSALGVIALGLFYVATFVISIAFAKRRLNDLDRSGWWFLLFIIPLVNLLLAIYLIFFPGSDGANRFGPAPSANSVGVLILGWSMPVLFVAGIVAAVAIPQYAAMMG